MKPDIKRSIVLAVLMLALGLIFLPMMLDPRDAAQPQLPSRIPPPPAVPVLPEPAQSRPVILADTPALDVPAEARVAEEARVEDSAADWREIPLLDERGLPRGWSLRLGLFADEDEAHRLLSQLLEAGYRAYIREQQAGPDLMRAVLVGPWLGRDAAQDYRARLAREFGVSGVILPFELQRF